MWKQLSETCWARIDVGFVFIPDEEENPDLDCNTYVAKHNNYPARQFDTLEKAIAFVNLKEEKCHYST